MKLLFVAIAGAEIGYGHLSRCISLADFARREAIGSSFLLLGDAGMLQRIERAGYHGSVQPCSALAGQTIGIGQSRAEAFDAVVVDLTHPLVLGDIDGGRKLFRDLRDHVRTLMVIDAMGEQAIAPRMPDLPADVLVVPYVGATVKAGAPWRTLAGPEFAVLAQAYGGLPPRVVREHADRVLVSCGGADPRGLSLLVMDGIEQIPAVLTVRVVVGPLFSRELADALAARAAVSRHMVELIHAPEGLADHIFWSDLTIAASGLIKYELAASSTPAILMSINRIHDTANRPFVKMGSARDIGVDFDPQSAAQAVSELLDDHVTRSAMAEAGRRLVDGKGASRVITELIRTCSVAR